jgi:hypothetical protein
MYTVVCSNANGSRSTSTYLAPPVERCRAQGGCKAPAQQQQQQQHGALPLRAWTVGCGLWAVDCGLRAVNGGVEGAPARSCPLLPAPCERWHWVRGDPPNWTFSQARQAG